jgi:hypothetical protein
MSTTLEHALTRMRLAINEHARNADLQLLRFGEMLDGILEATQLPRPGIVTHTRRINEAALVELIWQHPVSVQTPSGLQAGVTTVVVTVRANQFCWSVRDPRAPVVTARFWDQLAPDMPAEFVKRALQLAQDPALHRWTVELRMY